MKRKKSLRNKIIKFYFYTRLMRYVLTYNQHQDKKYFKIVTSSTICRIEGKFRFVKKGVEWRLGKATQVFME